jgi:hypothetical protein
MDAIHAKQLMLAKYLFGQGEKALDIRNPMACGVAISHFQDAVEMLLWTAVKQRDLGNARKEMSFFDLWKSVEGSLRDAKLPHYSSMTELNNARVNFKHFGNLPEPSDAEKFLSYTREFLTEAAKLVFDTAFESLSLADLVLNARVKDLLKTAEGHLTQNELEQCMNECAQAEHIVSGSLSQVFPTVPSHLTDYAGLFDRDKQTYARRLFDGLREYLNALRDVSFSAILGIPANDFLRYAALKRIIPAVTEYMDHHIATHSRGHKYSPEDARFAVRYVTDYALAVQTHVRRPQQSSLAQ